jgi:hypothetical protein
MNVNAVVVAAILRILRIVGESEFLRAATTALVETLTNFEVMLPLDFAWGSIWISQHDRGCLHVGWTFRALLSRYDESVAMKVSRW